MASPEVQAAIAAITRNTTVDGSAVVLIQQLKGLVDSHVGDMAGLGTAVAELVGSTDSLEAAVFAGTGTPAPTPTP